MVILVIVSLQTVNVFAVLSQKKGSTNRTFDHLASQALRKRPLRSILAFCIAVERPPARRLEEIEAPKPFVGIPRRYGLSEDAAGLLFGIDEDHIEVVSRPVAAATV
jgi:hypothetical protein